MRFAIYATILFSILPLVFLRPFFGLCVYYVVSLLQPKLFCWRPDFPDAMIVGVPLVAGAIIFGVRRYVLVPQRAGRGTSVQSLAYQRIRSPLFERTWLVGLIAVLFTYIAATRAIVPFPLESNSFQFRNLCKILVVVVLMTGLVADFRRLRIVYLVIALSAAFWAIKGGAKVLVIGPHAILGRSYDNNLFALMSVMSLPMLFYFGISVPRKWRRWALLACACFTCVAIIGSHSRAGFLALGVVIGGMAWSSRSRWRAVAAVTVVGVVAIGLSGPEIRERVTSIADYEKDRSARSRFATWQLAIDLAVKHPLIGVGFGNFETAKAHYVGGRKAAHNIYLQNLAELGLLGHPLWLAVLFGSMAKLYLFMRRARKLPPDMRWAYHWSRGLLLGLIGYFVHGIFHNEQYLELMLIMIGLAAVLRRVARQQLRERRWKEELTEAPVPAASARLASPLHAGAL